jgi:hypothetical protein
LSSGLKFEKSKQKDSIPPLYIFVLRLEKFTLVKIINDYSIIEGRLLNSLPVRLLDNHIGLDEVKAKI